jgi:hypothetical protein
VRGFSSAASGFTAETDSLAEREGNSLVYEKSRISAALHDRNGQPVYPIGVPRSTMLVESYRYLDRSSSDPQAANSAWGEPEFEFGVFRRTENRGGRTGYVNSTHLPFVLSAVAHSRTPFKTDGI